MERYPGCLLEAIRSRQLEREGQDDGGKGDEVRKKGKDIYNAGKVEKSDQMSRDGFPTRCALRKPRFRALNRT